MTTQRLHHTVSDETRILRFLRAIEESDSYSDRYVIGRALALDPYTVHGICADLEWRGFLRRHSPKCSKITLTKRGNLAARQSA